MNDNILSFIETEHEVIRKALRKVSESRSELRAQLYAIAREKVVKHMQSEESTIYRKVLEENLRSHDLIVELLQDHQVTKETFQKLNLMDPWSPKWDELFQGLIRRIEDHCKKEESCLFHEVKEDLSSEDMKRMVSDYQIAKRESPNWVSFSP